MSLRALSNMPNPFSPLTRRFRSARSQSTARSRSALSVVSRRTYQRRLLRRLRKRGRGENPRAEDCAIRPTKRQHVATAFSMALLAPGTSTWICSVRSWGPLQPPGKTCSRAKFPNFCRSSLKMRRPVCTSSMTECAKTRESHRAQKPPSCSTN